MVKTGLVAGLFGLTAMTNANASVVYTYNASSAVKDSYSRYSGGHSLWLPIFSELTGEGSAKRFDFTDTATLTVEHYGTAILTGTIQSQLDPELAFDVVFNFEAESDSFGPKRELSSDAYIENGGTIDTSLFDFFSIESASLTGLDSLDGLNLDVTQRGDYDFQIGEGASGKNLDLGASVWFNAIASSLCDNSFCAAFTTAQIGDVNIDLEATSNLEVAPVPVPGAIILFATGLAGYAGSRRKKAKA